MIFDCKIVLVLLIIVTFNEAIVVNIKDGSIRGKTFLTRESRTCYGFKGIPFAKPPVGDLRFKDPKPPLPWNDILNVTEDAPKCIQKNYFASIDPQVEGEEDCLYLNVYTPNIETCTKKLPVMVYIFYGGFFAGSARSDHVGPEYLLDKDIVLVTTNYRLGALGFLSLGNDDAAGNWGMKDQSLALKWVQDNIDTFCGNKDQVTIVGCSTAAASVHLHMFSPISKGLFHRGISQSGTAVAAWARPHNSVQIEVARQQAGFVGCNSTASTDIIISCLRTIPANTLVDSSKFFKVILVEPTLIYALVAEKRTPLNPKPFLEEDPYDLLRNGTFDPIPWIFGAVQDEGLVKTGYLLRNQEYKSLFVKNLDVNLPISLGLQILIPSDEIPLVHNELVEFYLDGDTQISNEKSVQGFTDLFSDTYINYATYQTSLLQAMKSKAPVWVYKYNYRSEVTYTDYFSYTAEPVNGTLGICQVDDLIPLFYSPAILEKNLTSFSDLIMSYNMVQMWTSFATNGNPSPNNMFMRFDWKPLTNLYGEEQVNISDLYYLDISGPTTNFEEPIKFQMKNDFLVNRMKFLDELGIFDIPPEINTV